MSKPLPKSSKVVVIGGGVAGCSVAYHLAKFGWKDTVLLERDQLTSGTTWHAAGLVGQLGATATITKLRKYSLNLYKELEKKTELSTGLKQNGAITVASSKTRLQELLRQPTSAQLFNVNVEVLEELGRGRLFSGVIQGNIEEGSLMAGQIAGHIKEIKPVKAIIQDIMIEAEQVLESIEKYKS